MQIREQGKKVQLIRSTYEKDKGRNTTKVIAYFDRHSDRRPSDDVWQKLRDDEKAQLEAWLAQREALKVESDKKLYAEIAPGSIRRLVAAVPEMTLETAIQVWEEIANLQKALKKAGYRRPKKDAVESQNPPQAAAS